MICSLKRNNLLQFLGTVFVLILGGANLFAQSLDVSNPAPIRSSQVVGKIAARDLGDSRLTDHYYAFSGTPGDLLITVKSKNLNGDLDVFTATTLRPLLKLSLYAESTTPVTKGIYLRKREDLILRIEARSPNDDEGTYQLFFGGSFAPAVGGPEIAEVESDETNTTNPSTGRKTKRVNSVGARIDEPEPAPVEVAVAPTPEPTSEEKPVESPEPKKARPSPTPASSARGRRPAGRRTPAPPAEKPPSETTEEAKKEEPEVSEPAVTKPKTSTRGTSRRSASTTRPVTPPPEPEPEIGPRLVIETNDGTLINRSMTTVRRVTVENGQVVVTGKDGKIDRILLINIVRMSIAQ